jgi:hypothetical protein
VKHRGLRFVKLVRNWGSLNLKLRNFVAPRNYRFIHLIKLCLHLFFFTFVFLLLPTHAQSPHVLGPHSRIHSGPFYIFPLALALSTIMHHHSEGNVEGYILGLPKPGSMSETASNLIQLKQWRENKWVSMVMEGRQICILYGSVWFLRVQVSNDLPCKRVEAREWSNMSSSSGDFPVELSLLNEHTLYHTSAE